MSLKEGTLLRDMDTGYICIFIGLVEDDFKNNKYFWPAVYELQTKAIYTFSDIDFLKDHYEEV